MLIKNSSLENKVLYEVAFFNNGQLIEITYYSFSFARYLTCTCFDGFPDSLFMGIKVFQ